MYMANIRVTACLFIPFNYGFVCAVLNVHVYVYVIYMYCSIRLSLSPLPLLSSLFPSSPPSSPLLGNKHVVRREHMNLLKDGCVVGNMGHSVHEIDTHCLKDLKREKIRPHVAHIIWPDERRIVLLAEVSGCGQRVWLMNM